MDTVGFRSMPKDLRAIMMYYWIVKHDGSEDQDIVSYREDIGTLRQHHIVVESLSPFLNGASFVLGRQISTERTWRDLNDTLVAYLQLQSFQNDGEQYPLGINIGTIVAFKNPMPQNLKGSFSKSRGGIF